MFLSHESAEIYSNRRSDVDEGNKRNVIKNLQTEIEKLTTREVDIIIDKPHREKTAAIPISIL